MKNKVIVEINTVPGYVKGQVITLAAKNGIPLIKFWRDRIKDSETDNCLTIIKKQPNKSSNSGSTS